MEGVCFYMLKKMAAVMMMVCLGLGAMAACSPRNKQGEPGTTSEMFDDVRFEQLVRNTLNKPEGEITPADMAGITEFVFPAYDAMGNEVISSDQRIRSIKGIEHCVNLVYISFYDHDIVDISPLSNLVLLERVDLSKNEIVDITALGNLTGLTKVILSGNKIADVSALSNLSAVTELSLSGNNVSDISALSGMKALRWLDLSGNKLTDLSPLNGLGAIDMLWIMSNGSNIEDWSPVDHIPSVYGRS